MILTKPLRHFILTLLFLAYFIIAPLLLLTASGYKYNWQKNKFEKIGLITLETDEEKIKIFLNGKENKKISKINNVWQINNLLPNIYEIAIYKDGYLPWQKKIEVYGGKSSLIKNIILFKKEPPTTIYNQGKIILFKPSPDKKNIAIAVQENNINKLLLINTLNQEQNVLWQGNINSVIKIQWSPTSQKILAELSDQDVVIFDTKNHLLQNLSFLPTNAKKNFHWSEDSDYTLFSFNQNTLYKINLINNVISPILSIPIKSEEIINDQYLLKKNYLYFILTSIDKSILVAREISPNPKQAKTFSFQLDNIQSSPFFLTGGGENTINLLDKDKQKLYIIDQDTFIIKRKNIAKMAIYDNELAQWIYYTDNEIWRYKEKKEQAELINRYGQAIQKVLIIDKNECLVFSTNNTINIINDDINNEGTTYNISQFDEIYDFSLNNFSNDVYIWGKSGQIDGIFKQNFRK